MLCLKNYTVAVHDLDEAIENHSKRFGMQKVGDRGFNDVGKFDFQAMGYGDATLLLLCQPTHESPIAKLMSERQNDFNPHGEGMYLIAYETDDVDTFCKQVEENGGRVTRIPGAANAWVHPTSSHFVLMEILPKS